MLHGRILASPYAHALIKSIDVSEAQAMGAVVVTPDDIPDVCYNERIITIPGVLHRDNHVLADKVRHMGEAVAAVAAQPHSYTSPTLDRARASWSEWN